MRIKHIIFIVNENNMTELTFKQKVQDIIRRVENIHHRKKADTAYWEAHKISLEMTALFPSSNNIRLDAKILKDYSFKASDKRKEEVIENFKKETIFDLLPIANRDEEITDISIE